MLRCFRSELNHIHCTLRLQDLQPRRVMEGVIAWKAKKPVQSVPPSLARHEYKVGTSKNACCRAARQGLRPESFDLRVVAGFGIFNASHRNESVTRAAGFL